MSGQVSKTGEMSVLDPEREVEHGKEDGARKIEHGGAREMEDGKVEQGKWSKGSGARKMEQGKWSQENGASKVKHGRWREGRWSTKGGVRKDGGRWSREV